MAAHDGVSCGRGPIARLIDHARWCSATTAAAAAAGMLHSRGRQQHLGYSKYWGNFARQMHWQDVVADPRQSRWRRLRTSMAPHHGWYDRARWTLNSKRLL